LLKQQGFAGLKDGLFLCYGLTDRSGTPSTPNLKMAMRRPAELAGFVGTRLEIPLKLVPVVEKAPYGSLDYSNRAK